MYLPQTNIVIIRGGDEDEIDMLRRRNNYLSAEKWQLKCHFTSHDSPSALHRASMRCILKDATSSENILLILVIAFRLQPDGTINHCGLRACSVERVGPETDVLNRCSMLIMKKQQQQDLVLRVETPAAMWYG